MEPRASRDGNASGEEHGPEAEVVASPRVTTRRPGERMAPDDERAAKRWLSIDSACKLLGVDQSTLRRWSDAGKIPVFRTPGGHRRYAEEDLRALVRDDGRKRRVSREALTTMSLSGYEHEYLRQARQRPWFKVYEAARQDELRPLGRRMVDLTIRYISSRTDREAVLAESREIGTRYGESAARMGLAPADAVEAFLFFRTPVIQAVTRYIEDENVSTRRAARITSELTYFMDQVLVATVSAHAEEAGRAGRGAASGV